MVESFPWKVCPAGEVEVGQTQAVQGGVREQWNIARRQWIRRCGVLAVN